MSEAIALHKIREVLEKMSESLERMAPPKEEGIIQPTIEEISQRVMSAVETHINKFFDEYAPGENIVFRRVDRATLRKLILDGYHEIQATLRQLSGTGTH